MHQGGGVKGRPQQNRAIMLNAHTQPQGKKILDKMMIEQFVPISDSAYDSIREMNRWIARQKEEK
jgi:ABC-type phosphate/phosphonate transport system substrate-binding protein